MDAKEKKASGASSNVNVNNAVFVGSTAELLKAIKRNGNTE